MSTTTEHTVAEQIATLSAMALQRQIIDQALSALVADARANGATWGDIGAALGITRQAAHQRYART